MMKNIQLQGKEAVIHPREWWNSRQNYKTIFFSPSKRQIRSALQSPLRCHNNTFIHFFPQIFNFSLNYAPLLQIKHHIVDFEVFLYFSFCRFVFEIVDLWLLDYCSFSLEDPVKRHGDGGPASVSDCRFDRRVEERGHSAAPELDPEALHDRARARRGPHAEGADSVPQREQRRWRRSASRNGRGIRRLHSLRRRRRPRQRASSSLGDSLHRWGNLRQRQIGGVAVQNWSTDEGARLGWALHSFS